MLSTHIPQSGPLDPAAVDASFVAAQRFFARHFPEFPTTELHCGSWLLDPHLAEALPEASNIAGFARRWRLYGEPMAGDEDALFFTFHRRGDVDLSQLPRDTTLQRVIIDRLRAGRHWQLWHGRCPQPQPERSPMTVSARAPQSARSAVIRPRSLIPNDDSCARNRFTPERLRS